MSNPLICGLEAGVRSGEGWPAARVARRIGCLAIASALTLMAGGVGAAENVDAYLERATAAMRRGQVEEALRACEEAIAAFPKDGKPHVVHGRIASQQGEGEKAVAAFDAALAKDGQLAAAYQYRGLEQFKLGRVEASIGDFDKYVELVPQSDPYHWQRGISYYYAGKFEEGAKQFERHQTVNARDVENAVWHFLCRARASGLAEAKAALIPIAGDSRVPMQQVHALFAGTGTVEGVWDAVRRGPAAKAQRERSEFYAHLYLGLYYEATQDAARALEHIRSAADRSKDQDYMGAVARVHAGRLGRAKEE